MCCKINEHYTALWLSCIDFLMHINFHGIRVIIDCNFQGLVMWNKKEKIHINLLEVVFVIASMYLDIFSDIGIVQAA